MNNSLNRVFDDIIRLLRDGVIPSLDDATLRSQTFGAIFMLKNLQLRVDWANAPLLTQIRAHDRLFDELRALGVDVDAAAGPRVPVHVPSSPELLALRDTGNALISRLIASPAGDDASANGAEARALIVACMRAELDTEMQYTAKPMFAEMSSGESQP